MTTKIALYRGPYAPTGYIICVAFGEEGKYAWDERDEENSKLIQVDWDFPGVATSFGWSVSDVQREGRPRCEHDGTDGTIACASCGMTPGEFIESARGYLNQCADDCKVVDDPGYFGG